MAVRLTLILLLITNFVYSQHNQKVKYTDTVLVKECIEHYFKASDSANIDELTKAFDPGAMMFWVDSTGRIEYNTQKAWKQKMKQVSKPEKAIERKILHIDITNDICVAKIKSTFPDKVYLDYLALIKVGMKWRIVNKIFVQYNPNLAPTFDSVIEKEQIKSLIETKLKSMDKNDPDLLASAYYPRAMSYYIDNSEMVAVSIAEWIARFDNDKRKANDKMTKASRKIETIDVFKEIGYVSFTHTFSTNVVTDKVLVLKIDNRWRIINLLFTNED
jgi:hypothetical protein